MAIMPLQAIYTKVSYNAVVYCIITPWHGNAFRVIGPLWGESAGNRCITIGQKCGALMAAWISCWKINSWSYRWFETPWQSCDVTHKIHALLRPHGWSTMCLVQKFATKLSCLEEVGLHYHILQAQSLCLGLSQTIEIITTNVLYHLPTNTHYIYILVST